MVQPVWLANGQKDFFSNFAGLPSAVNVAEPLAMRAPALSPVHVSPKTRQGAFSSLHRRSSQDDPTFDASSSNGHGTNSTFSPPSSVFSLPTMPSAIAAPAALPKREIPAVIEEEGDSDFLRAVLNFGEGAEGDLNTSPSSFRGAGRLLCQLDRVLWVKLQVSL